MLANVQRHPAVLQLSTSLHLDFSQLTARSAAACLVSQVSAHGLHGQCASRTEFAENACILCVYGQAESDHAATPQMGIAVRLCVPAQVSERGQMHGAPVWKLAEIRAEITEWGDQDG